MGRVLSFFPQPYQELQQTLNEERKTRTVEDKYERVKRVCLLNSILMRRRKAAGLRPAPPE